MSRHLSNRSFSDDPFEVCGRWVGAACTDGAQAMTRPPVDESLEDKQRRQSEELAAKQRSELIDEEIKRDRQARLRAEASQRKLLLLGMAPETHYKPE